ncbi:MAG: metallophosphoesterase [Paludibacter sp.]
MENKLIRSIHILVVFMTFLFSGCSLNVDIGGFFFPADLIDSRFKQSEQWNSNHPFKQLTVISEDYQILVAGDSHIGGFAEVSHSEGLKNFTKLVIEAQKPENTAFLIVGDVVSGKKEDYDSLKAYLPDFNKTPYFLQVGNHDLFFDGWKTFYSYFGSSTYYFSIKTPTVSDLYICLDSGSGTLGVSQLAWLKNVLETKRANYRNCFVFSHVNFFRNRRTGSTNPLVDELYVLMDLFSTHRVNMVISGHDHVRSLNYFGFTTYITMDALLDANPNASILKLTVSLTKTSFSFMDLN